MNYAIMNEYAVDPNSSQFKAPFNQIKNEARVFTYKDTAVVTANSDTPYSLGWLDLRAEPMVVTIPTVKDRYYSVMLNDGHTYNYGYMGSRATGGKAGSYMVVGPDWKGEKTAGIDEVFHSLTPFSLIAFRTQLMNPADMPNVEKIQAQYKLQPLSAFLGQPAPAAAPNPDLRPESRRTSGPISAPRLNTFPKPMKTKTFARNWPLSASAPARNSTSRASHPSASKRWSRR